MLHAIDKDGTITWHCPEPHCSYHNCAEWDRGISCATHPAGRKGKSHSAHISHEAILWTGHDHILLPVCQECGSQWGLKVHSDIAEPIIAKDEQTGKILQVTMPEGYAHHGNLWFRDMDIVHTPIPHPTLAHLSLEDIHALQEQIKAKAPDAPTDWMVTSLPHEIIHAVYPHPAVARHQELARQLQAIGKGYVEPPVLLPEPMVPLSQVKDLVHGILKEHGITPLEDTEKQQAILPPTT